MKRAISLLAAALLAGCASYGGAGLRPGTDTESDVARVMGAPALRLAAADGSHELIYPRGPLGVQTFIAHVGPDGVLRSIDQVLDDDHFFPIHPGQSQDDILRMIGPPGETMEFSRQHQVAWSYRYLDTWGYLSEFSVTFDANGRVVSKFSRRLNDDKDDDRR